MESSGFTGNRWLRAEHGQGRGPLSPLFGRSTLPSRQTTPSRGTTRSNWEPNPLGLDARKLRLASKNTPGVDGKSWLTDRHSPGRCDWAPLSARPVQMNPSSGWSSKALVDNGTNSGLPTIPGLLGEAKVRETLAQKLAQLRQETRETKHGCNAIAQHSVDVVRRPMTSTTPSERMCSIDADTDVPEGLFNELLKLGRQAKERGQHVLAPESSSPWTGSRRTARLLRHDHSSSFCLNGQTRHARWSPVRKSCVTELQSRQSRQGLLFDRCFAQQ